MNLVDTPVRIDQLRRSDEKLAALLHDSLVLIQPSGVGAQPVCKLPRNPLIQGISLPTRRPM